MLDVVLTDERGRETRRAMPMAEFREWMRAGGWTNVCAAIDAGTFRPGGLYLVNDYLALRVVPQSPPRFYVARTRAAARPIAETLEAAGIETGGEG